MSLRHISTPNKSYVYLLNAEPSNLVFLKNCNTEFNDILMFLTFTEQSGKPLDRKGKFNLTLLINKKGWHVILQNQQDMSKDIDFCHGKKFV